MVAIDPSAAAMLALAIWKAKRAGDLAEIQIKLLKKQADLARKYRDIFGEQRAFYRDNFRSLVESRVRFYATDPNFTPDYAASYGGAWAFVFGLSQKSRRIIFGSNNPTDVSYASYYGRRATMYGLAFPADPFINYYIYGQLDLSKVDAIDHAYRYEEYKENIYSARRFDRLTAVAEYSNKHTVAAARDGASSFGYLANALTAKGNYYGARANDLFYAAGNYFQRGVNSFMAGMNVMTGGLKTGQAPYSDALTYAQRMEQHTYGLTYNLPNGGMVLK